MLRGSLVNVSAIQSMPSKTSYVSILKCSGTRPATYSNARLSRSLIFFWSGSVERRSFENSLPACSDFAIRALISASSSGGNAIDRSWSFILRTGSSNESLKTS